jgi:phage-related minor tail protein
MSFNLQKYLIENNLTLRSNLALNEDDEESDKEETSSETSSQESDPKKIEKYKQELKNLEAKAKDIIFKFTKDTEKGKILTNVTAYKSAIGNIPQKIKDLKKKIGEPETED